MNWKLPHWKIILAKKETCESKTYLILLLGWLTVCVTRAGAGDGEAVQLEKWKGVENCLRFSPESPASGARFVGQTRLSKTCRLKKTNTANLINFYTQLNFWQWWLCENQNCGRTKRQSQTCQSACWKKWFCKPKPICQNLDWKLWSRLKKLDFVSRQARQPPKMAIATKRNFAK